MSLIHIGGVTTKVDYVGFDWREIRRGLIAYGVVIVIALVYICYLKLKKKKL